MSNQFGKLFRITTWGESHGKSMGVVIDGCPPCLPLDKEDIAKELRRRRPGQSSVTSDRQETDDFEILSGVANGMTLGSPIAINIPNKDARPKDYDHLKGIYRPSHADYTYHKKYGIRPTSGGGRASARETVARVAAGAVARKILEHELGIDIVAYTSQIGTITLEPYHEEINHPSRHCIELSPVRCPNLDISVDMQRDIERARIQGDSLGGAVTCILSGVPVGLGAPVFDRLEADLAKAMLSIPATKGFELGTGFEASFALGSMNNDTFRTDLQDNPEFATNNAGGILGGISSGQNVYFRVGFKPPSTISKPQNALNEDGEVVTLQATGRHDPCVVPRAIPIIESMAALVFVDHYLMHRAQNTLFSFNEQQILGEEAFESEFRESDD